MISIQKDPKVVYLANYCHLIATKMVNCPYTPRSHDTKNFYKINTVNQSLQREERLKLISSFAPFGHKIYNVNVLNELCNNILYTLPHLHWFLHLLCCIPINVKSRTTVSD